MFFVIYSIIVTLLLIVSIFYNWKFAKIILVMEVEIENGIKVFDKMIKGVTEILKVPLFYDTPEIRKLLNLINNCRLAIINVADKLAALNEGGPVEENENSTIDSEVLQEDEDENTDDQPETLRLEGRGLQQSPSPLHVLVAKNQRP